MIAIPSAARHRSFFLLALAPVRKARTQQVADAQDGHAQNVIHALSRMCYAAPTRRRAPSPGEQAARRWTPWVEGEPANTTWWEANPRLVRRKSPRPHEPNPTFLRLTRQQPALGMTLAPSTPPLRDALALCPACTSLCSSLAATQSTGPFLAASQTCLIHQSSQMTRSLDQASGGEEQSARHSPAADHETNLCTARGAGDPGSTPPPSNEAEAADLPGDWQWRRPAPPSSPAGSLDDASYAEDAVNLVTVYQLADDLDRVQAVQRATTASDDYGIAPDPALFGSPEWWAAIADGTLPSRRRAGAVSRVFWGSMGDWPEFALTEPTGEVTEWTRMGDPTLYVEGIQALVVTVKQSGRTKDAQAHEVILEVQLEQSDSRSSPFGPGPFAARMGAVELFRPVGEAEAQLIVDAPNRFPPRLEGQPIFYPVTNFEYACHIARDWNTKDAASGFAGYVTRFYVDSDFLSRYEIHQVGGSQHTEYWIPAQDLLAFNDHIVGPIEFVAEFHREGDLPPRRHRFGGRRG